MTARAVAVAAFLIWPGELRRRSQTPAQRPLLSRLGLHLTQSRQRPIRNQTLNPILSQTMTTMMTTTTTMTMTGSTARSGGMTMWKPIETAPKDGTWVLLRGGNAQDGSFDLRYLSEAEQEAVDRRPVVAKWVSAHSEDGWAYAAWDSDWRSFYFEPVEWMEIPG